MSDPEPTTPATTLDTLFGGALRLRQPARGHRAGSDAVLLAAACPKGAVRIVDLGCGVGTVGLRAAQTSPGAEVVLVDNSAEIAEFCRENIDLNRPTRARLVAADIMGRAFPGAETDLAGWADTVLTNPPFVTAGTVRRSPTALKASAHVLEGSLDQWLVGALKCLAPKGHLVLIHRADAVPEILAALAGRFGDLRLRFIHPRADAPAHRLLVRATVGSRAPVTVLPPLVLHGADGVFTPEAAAIHAGTAAVAWDQQTR